jgi:predicted ATPase
MLKTIKLLHDRVENWDAYPFSVSAIRSLDELDLRSRVCLFAGENGTGKSTLIEAIAAHYGFGREGGNRNFGNNSTKSNQSIDPLVRALRLSFDRRTGAGYFLRAESFFNTVSDMDRLDEEPSFAPPISAYYGGRSMHTRSHGETFFTLLDLKFRRNGLFLLDEPEAALSPQRQLSFLVLIHDVLQKYKTHNSSSPHTRQSSLAIPKHRFSLSTRAQSMKLSTRAQRPCRSCDSSSMTDRNFWRNC